MYITTYYLYYFRPTYNINNILTSLYTYYFTIQCYLYLNIA